MHWGSTSQHGRRTFRIANRVLAYAKTLSRDERLAIAARIRAIGENPDIDLVERIPLPMPPAIFGVDVASPFWIVYHTHGDTIDIYNVGRATVSAPVPW